MTNPLTDEVIDKAVDAYDAAYSHMDRGYSNKLEAMRAAAKVIESALAGDRRDKDCRSLILAALMDHRLQYWVDEDGDNFPLVDQLTPPNSGSISLGVQELEYLSEAIDAAIKGKSHE